MRFLLIGIAFMLTMLALIPVNRAARADAQTRVYLVSCLPDANLFEIRVIGIFDEPSGLVSATRYDLTEKGHALYSAAWAFYQFELASDERTESQVPSPTLFECSLHTSTIELFVVPILIRGDQGVEDIVVSLGIASHWVVDNVPFYPCNDRGPIKRLAYEGDQGEITFEGRFGGVWPDKLNSREAWDNGHRSYSYGGSRLRRSGSVTPDEKVRSIPLTTKDIDYFQDPSSESYGLPPDEC